MNKNKLLRILGILCQMVICLSIQLGCANTLERELERTNPIDGCSFFSASEMADLLGIDIKRGVYNFELVESNPNKSKADCNYIDSNKLPRVFFQYTKADYSIKRYKESNFAIIPGKDPEKLHKEFIDSGAYKNSSYYKKLPSLSEYAYMTAIEFSDERHTRFSYELQFIYQDISFRLLIYTQKTEVKNLRAFEENILKIGKELISRYNAGKYKLI